MTSFFASSLVSFPPWVLSRYHLPMKRPSLGPAGIPDLTWARFRYISAEFADGCESSTVGIPFFPGTIGGVMKSDIDCRAAGSPVAQRTTGWVAPEDWET